MTIGIFCFTWYPSGLIGGYISKNVAIMTTLAHTLHIDITWPFFIQF